MPNVWPSNKKGHTATSQHYLFPHGSVGRRWGPAEDRGGGASTARRNHLLLATPAVSLERPEDPAMPLPGRTGVEDPTPAERLRFEPRRLVEGCCTGDCSRPLQGAPPRTSCQSPPSPPRQPGNSHTQRHLRQSSQQPDLRFPGRRVNEDTGEECGDSGVGGF